MSLKAVLDSRIAEAKAQVAARDLGAARRALEALADDPVLGALPPVTALGLNRRLHAALLRLAKAEGDRVARAGLQLLLVPPPEMLAHLAQATTAERRDLASANEREVPRVIHQIWIGPQPVPPAVAAWAGHAAAQGYAYRLWREEALAEAGYLDEPVCRAMLDRGDYPGAVDALRYAILAQHGGIYLDCDWYPARDDVGFHDLMPLRGLLALTEDVPRLTSTGGLLLANSFIAAPPGHPVLAALLVALPRITELLPGGPAWWTTGPLPFTLVARRGTITLADAALVAATLPRMAPMAEVQALRGRAVAEDLGLLIGWKSW